MECPACKKRSLSVIELVPNLSGSICEKCKGTWISRNNYDAWRSKQKGDLPEISTLTEIAINEPLKPKLCPQCRHLLLPYRVGHWLSFSIDYCGTCGGIWFDQDEWPAIKAKNLHDNLHEIVSSHWQAAVRQEETQKLIEQTYKRLLGTTYDKAFETRDWLRKQSKKGLILAYLFDLKPYKK